MWLLFSQIQKSKRFVLAQIFTICFWPLDVTSNIFSYCKCYLPCKEVSNSSHQLQTYCIWINITWMIVMWIQSCIEFEIKPGIHLFQCPNFVHVHPTTHYLKWSWRYFQEHFNWSIPKIAKWVMRWWPLSGPQPFCSQPKSKLQYLHHTPSQTIIGNQTVCGIFECNGSSNMAFNIWSQPWCCHVLQIQHFPLPSYLPSLFFQSFLSSFTPAQCLHF